MDKVPLVADLNFLDNTFQDTCSQTPLNVPEKKKKKKSLQKRVLKGEAVKVIMA